MTTGESIANFAAKYVGTPYVWGGNDLKSGIDCSGLVQQVYKQYGINLPRVTYDQIGQGKAVSLKGLKPGDLVFFDTIKNTKGPDHVGIYMGQGKMVHAPRPGKSVEVTDLTKGYYYNAFVGGRRIDGVHVAGGSDADYDFAPGEVGSRSPREAQEEAAARSGWAYSLFESDPGLKKIMGDYVNEDWDDKRLAAAIRDSDWWKSNSEAMRQAQNMKLSDPASYRAAMEATHLQVQLAAAKVGAAVPPNQMKKIAEDVLNTGMNEDQLRQALAGFVGFTKNGTMLGEAALHESKIRRDAYNQGIDISDDAIKNQAQRIIRGVATYEDFNAEMRDAAKSMYPGYAQQLDAGMNMMQIAQPYIQMMSKELELPDTDLDLKNPTIKGALNGLTAEGKPAGLTLTQFQSQLRADPRWRNTKGAQDSVMNLTTGLLQDMGLL